MKDHAVLEVRPNGATICHFRGKKGGCEDVAKREHGRYVKHLLDLTDIERKALSGFVAFSCKDPNDTRAVEMAVEQIYQSLQA